MGNFDDVSAIRPVSAGVFSATLDPDWSVGGKAHGGYLLAVAARAALAESSHPDPLAVSGQFIRAPEFGEVTVRVELLRTGRNVSNLRVRLEQDGEPRLEALVTTSTLPSGEEEPEWSDLPLAVLPDVASCPRAEPGDNPDVGILRVVEQHPDPAVTGWYRGEPTGDPEIRLWSRFADGAPADPIGLIALLDAGPPATFNLGAPGWAPTLELTAYLRARPAPGWLRFQHRARVVSGGWFDEDCWLWDSRGRLVAQSRQLAGVRFPAAGLGIDAGGQRA